MNIVITESTGSKSIAAKFAAAGYRLFISSRNAVKLYAAVEDLMNHFRIPNRGPAFDLKKKHRVSDNGFLIRRGTGCIGKQCRLFIPGTVESEEDGTLETMIETNLTAPIISPGQFAGNDEAEIVQL
jgi:short-subunit dehydrogenase